MICWLILKKAGKDALKRKKTSAKLVSALRTPLSFLLMCLLYPWTGGFCKLFFHQKDATKHFKKREKPSNCKKGLAKIKFADYTVGENSKGAVETGNVSLTPLLFFVYGKEKIPNEKSP